MKESYKRAKQQIVTNKDKLESIAKALLEYETLTEHEIKLIIDGKDLKAYREIQS